MSLWVSSVLAAAPNSPASAVVNRDKDDAAVEALPSSAAPLVPALPVSRASPGCAMRGAQSALLDEEDVTSLSLPLPIHLHPGDCRVPRSASSWCGGACTSLNPRRKEWPRYSTHSRALSSCGRFRRITAPNTVPWYPRGVRISAPARKPSGTQVWSVRSSVDTDAWSGSAGNRGPESTVSLVVTASLESTASPPHVWPGVRWK
mmetsp:Transcript_25309/g.63368  ORF Transcript_25309/g.63368 Transcript_25309/m.63368 type:complete len:204 (-) Transcript_25309:103-714(-)